VVLLGKIIAFVCVISLLERKFKEG
jgi:hypothetical protein